MRIFTRKFFLATFSLAVLVSGCTKHKTFYYKVLPGVNLFNEDNSGTEPRDAATPFVQSKTYAIRMEFSSIITGSDDGYDEKYENHYVNSRSATDIHVYSLTDYDPTHPALSSLNDRFYSLTDTSGYFLDTSVYGALNTSLRLGDLKSNTDTGKGNSYLIMMHPPSITGYRTFVVNITYSDNTTSSDTLTVTLL